MSQLNQELLDIVQRNLDLQQRQAVKDKKERIEPDLKVKNEKLAKAERKLAKANSDILALEGLAAKFMRNKFPTREEIIANFKTNKDPRVQEKGDAIAYAYSIVDSSEKYINELKSDILRLENQKAGLEDVKVTAKYPPYTQIDLDKPRFIEEEAAAPIVRPELSVDPVIDVEAEENILVVDSSNTESTSDSSTKILRQGILIGSDGAEKVWSTEKTKMRMDFKVDVIVHKYPFGIPPRKERVLVGDIKGNGFRVRSFQKGETMLAKRKAGVYELKK